MLVLVFLIAIFFAFVIKFFNRNYNILVPCKRVKTVDGTTLDSKILTIPGKIIFGNGLDLINTTPEKAFQYLREKNRISKGKSYLLHYPSAPIYNITNAEDAEQIFQSTTLITKSFVYDMIKPFLGLGLLISTDEKWQFRRKILTPAFHFNILQAFLEVFKEESFKFIERLKENNNQIISLDNVIPEFTLNNVCETALGVKLDTINGSDIYRKAIHDMEPLLIKRFCNPFMYSDFVYRFFEEYRQQQRLIQITHDFSSKIIQKRREEFQKCQNVQKHEEISDEFGKKKRYAMLDTLLDAEKKGLIDNEGICDEVNTFMFEGFDTTSNCLMFALVNLANHQDIQQKCFEEIKNLDTIDSLTVFDFNKLEYLECIIKETLRLYPSVPFLARTCTTETILNGLILPKDTQIEVHVYDIMRDEHHFPEPNKFNPERFRYENTTERHPFAFVPFSAGPRNCIGQKFAMLEVKVLLVAILRNFIMIPETTLDDLIFQNGLVLRCRQKLKIKVLKRE